MVLQDTIMLDNDQVRGKEAFFVNSQTEVDLMVREGLDLPRKGTGTYKWHHIANAFEMARQGDEGAYDIMRNCCASFVVDMMSYSGAPADVNALVNYFVQRWVKDGNGELLSDRDYLADIIPQAGMLRGLLKGTISDETLVSMIVKYYVWEYYDPNKAQLKPGSEKQKAFGSGNDPIQYFAEQLENGVDQKYAIAKEEVEKMGLPESYLHQDFSSSGEGDEEYIRNANIASDRGRSVHQQEAAGEHHRGLQGFCPICADGGLPTVPLDTYLYTNELCDGGNDVTCQVLQEEAALVTNPDLCAGYQELGHILCGCEARPDNLVCNPCPDGSAMPREFMDKFTNGCAECRLDSYAPYGTCRELLLQRCTEDNPERCLSTKRFGVSDCGCPSPDLDDPGVCNICPSGLPNPSKQITSTTDCAGLERLAASGLDDEFITCDAYQKVAGYYCDCPDNESRANPENTNRPNGETYCGICDDPLFSDNPEPLADGRRATLVAFDDCGETFILSDLQQEDAIYSDCFTLELLANANQELCDATKDGFSFSYLDCCDNQFFDLSVFWSPLCGDGTLLTDLIGIDPDSDLPFQFVDGTNATCRKLDNIISAFAPYGTGLEDPATASLGWWQVTNQYCGCAGGVSESQVEVQCFLCEGGELPEDKDRRALFNPLNEDGGLLDIHCGLMLQQAGALKITDPFNNVPDFDEELQASECRIYRDIGLRHCRCPIPSGQEDNCPICREGNGQLPNPDLEVLPFTDCDGLSRLASIKEDRECAAYQKVAGLYCGCPEYATGGVALEEEEASQDTCRICGVGSAIPFSNLARTVQLPSSVVVTCGELELQANIDSLENCNAYQTAGTSVCCDNIFAELPTSSPVGAPQELPTTSSPVDAPQELPTTSSPVGAPQELPTTLSPVDAPQEMPTTSSPVGTPPIAPPQKGKKGKKEHEDGYGQSNKSSKKETGF